MQRRIYRGDGLSPADLAEHLVAHYDPQENLQAQQIGRGDAHAVQIGRGDVPHDLRHAVTVAITGAPDGGGGLAVTLGQQQWLTPKWRPTRPGPDQPAGHALGAVRPAVARVRTDRQHDPARRHLEHD